MALERFKVLGGLAPSAIYPLLISLQLFLAIDYPNPSGRAKVSRWRDNHFTTQATLDILLNKRLAAPSIKVSEGSRFLSQIRQPYIIHSVNSNLTSHVNPHNHERKFVSTRAFTFFK